MSPRPEKGSETAKKKQKKDYPRVTHPNPPSEDPATSPRPEEGSETVREKQKKKYPRLTRNYQRWEQKIMIEYLKSNESISQGRGFKVWQKMIRDGHLEHRTPYSLNNHFRRKLLPNLDSFNIERKYMKKFKKLLK